MNTACPMQKQNCDNNRNTLTHNFPFVPNAYSPSSVYPLANASFRAYISLMEQR